MDLATKGVKRRENQAAIMTGCAAGPQGAVTSGQSRRYGDCEHLPADFLLQRRPPVLGVKILAGEFAERHE
jgi:hypothetical protein